jgi:hypothetical protein
MFPGENTPAANKTLLSFYEFNSTVRLSRFDIARALNPFPPEKIIMSLQIITILQPPLLNFLRIRVVRFFLSLTRSATLHYAVDIIDGYTFLGFINFYCPARRYPLVVRGE